MAQNHPHDFTKRHFFERRYGVCVLLVGLRPGAHMREAQVLQGAIDGVVRHREPELVMQPHDQIAGPPAHHAVDRRDRAFVHEPAEKGFVRVVELGRRAWRRDVDETVRPLLVVSDHPVPQCLAVHPADLRCFLPRSPVEHGRKRQKPSRLRPILRASRKPPNLTGRIIRPNRHCLAHGKQPSVCHLESRHRRFGNLEGSVRSRGTIESGTRA